MTTVIAHEEDALAASREIAQAVPNRVFVYGTLKRGGAWWSRLLAGRADAQFVGEDVVMGYALGPAFPGFSLVPKAFPKPNGLVRGEVFVVSGDLLAQLDKVERAYDGVRVTLHCGQTGAFMYAARPGEHCPRDTFESFPFPQPFPLRSA